MAFAHTMNKLVTLLLSIHIAFGYVFTGWSIRDLERNDTFFTLDTTSWTATRLRTSKSSTCYGTYLLGGYGVLGVINSQMNDDFSRQYTGLPTHTMVYFSLGLWAIDTWDQNSDYFIISFDLTDFNGWKSFDYSNFPASICGDSSFADLPNVRIFGSVAHLSNTLTFKITSKMSSESQSESFGIRDLNLMFVDGTAPLTTDTMCGKASIPIGSPDECSCSVGQYQSSPGVCTACDPTCASCFGSGSNRCYECKTGYSYNGTNCFPCYTNCTDCSGTGSSQCVACKPGYLLFRNNTCVASSDCTGLIYQTGGGRFCDSPCTNSSNFVYWNGTCISSCTTPLQQSTTLNTLVNTCVYPCSAGQYLYWNGTCISGCVSPLVQRTEGGKDFCDYPCTSSQYLYWNGTCSSNCTYPLSQRLEGGKNFCDYPCTGSNFLYWNATCISSCIAPLTQRTEGGKNFCDFSCSGSQYLYWNGTCSSSCASPLSQRLEGGKNFCDYLCSSTEYLYWDSACVSDCNTPLTPRVEGGKNFCDHPCLSTEYILMNGSCLTSCDFPLIQSSSHQITYCLLPCGNSYDFYYEETEECNSYCPVNSTYERGLYWNCPPHSTLAVPIVRLLHYIRYIDAKLPSKLERTTLSRGNNIISIRVVPEMLTTMRAEFANLTLPSVFEKPGVSSSFLANFLDDLILFAILFVCEALFRIFQALPIPNNRYAIKDAVRELQFLTGWNLPLMLMATNIGDIIFFSSLEYRTFDPSYSESIVSLSISIVMIIAAAGFLAGTFYLARKAKYNEAQGLKSEAYTSFLSRWQNFQVLFGGSGEFSLPDPYFFLIYCARQTIPMLFAAFLFDYPLAQIIIYLLINVGILCYILLQKPIQNTVDFINLVIIEGMLLLVNVSVLVLVIFSVQGAVNQYAEGILGDIIIIANYLIAFQAVLFVLFKAGIVIKKGLQIRKDEKNPLRKTIWLQLIFIPFQQGIFGFEQLGMREYHHNTKRVIPLTHLGEYMKEVRHTASPNVPINTEKIQKDLYQLLHHESDQSALHRKSQVFPSPPLSVERHENETKDHLKKKTNIKDKSRMSEILGFIATDKPEAYYNSPLSITNEEDTQVDPKFYLKRRKIIKESVFVHKEPEEA